MNVSVDGAYIYFTIPLFGGIPITQTTVSSFVVTLALVIACLCLGKNLQKRPTGIQVLVEKGVSMIYNLTASAMGQHNIHTTRQLNCPFQLPDPFFHLLFRGSGGGGRGAVCIAAYLV